MNDKCTVLLYAVFLDQARVDNYKYNVSRGAVVAETFQNKIRRLNHSNWLTPGKR